MESASPAEEESGLQPLLEQQSDAAAAASVPPASAAAAAAEHAPPSGESFLARLVGEDDDAIASLCASCVASSEEAASSSVPPRQFLAEALAAEGPADRDLSIGTDDAARVVVHFCRHTGADTRTSRTIVDVLLLLKPPLAHADLWLCLAALVRRFAPVALLPGAGQTLMSICRLFESLLLFHDPEIALLLKKAGVGAEMFCLPWLCTAHATGLADLLTVLHIWDVWISVGEPLDPVFLGLARLSLCRSELLLCGPVPELAQLLQTSLGMRQHATERVADVALRRAADLKAATPLSFLKRLQDALLRPPAPPAPQAPSLAAASESECSSAGSSTGGTTEASTAASTTGSGRKTGGGAAPMADQAGAGSPPAAATASPPSSQPAGEGGKGRGKAAAAVQGLARFGARASGWLPGRKAEQAESGSSLASGGKRGDRGPSIACMRVEAQDVMMIETVKERHLKSQLAKARKAAAEAAAEAQGQAPAAPDADGQVAASASDDQCSTAASEASSSSSRPAAANALDGMSDVCRLLPRLIDVRPWLEANRYGIKGVKVVDVSSKKSLAEFVAWAKQRSVDVQKYGLSPMHVLLTMDGAMTPDQGAFLQGAVGLHIPGLCILSGGYNSLEPFFQTPANEAVSSELSAAVTAVTQESKELLQKGVVGLQHLWEKAPSRQSLREKLTALPAARVPERQDAPDTFQRAPLPPQEQEVEEEEGAGTLARECSLPDVR